MITLLLLIPIIGSLLIVLIQEDSIKSQLKMKTIAISTSLLNLFISIFLWLEFDSSTTQFQFVYEFDHLSFCHFNLGLDGISLFFVLLTTFITPIAIISNYNNITKNLKYFLISFLILETLQLALFLVLDLLLFYIFFESVLPILFIVIIVYGSGEFRYRSANLFFLYTLFGSLFLLLSILTISSIMGTTDFDALYKTNFNYSTQLFLFYGIFIAFAVKTPTIFLNT